MCLLTFLLPLFYLCQRKNVLDRPRNALNTFLKFWLTSASTFFQKVLMKKEECMFSPLGFYTLCFHFYDTQRVSLICSKCVIMVLHYALHNNRQYFPKTLVMLKCKRRFKDWGRKTLSHVETLI